MKAICPGCEKEAKVTMVRKEEIVTVRGEGIPVVSEYRHCTACGSDFEGTRDRDSLEEAYREYRRRHHMLFPEEIRDFRKARDLSQKELGALLGWGGATLSRYENGALQADAHEKMLRLAMDPHCLRLLIDQAPDALPEAKRIRLAGELAETAGQTMPTGLRKRC
jgi:putative zinc finger/helix-turn-helix YgiT family protein